MHLLLYSCVGIFDQHKSFLAPVGVIFLNYFFALLRILKQHHFYIGPRANVHTGAPPPWLKANEHDPNNLLLRSRGPPGKGKSRKLNPKRVGAAWAERRRAEMEMEKRGEIVPETSDSSWLPNFGGVWQSGTRKESRKDFEKNHKLHDMKSNHELSLEIKPYISKRMRAGVDKASDNAEQLGSHLEQ